PPPAGRSGNPARPARKSRSPGHLMEPEGDLARRVAPDPLRRALPVPFRLRFPERGGQTGPRRLLPPAGSARSGTFRRHDTEADPSGLNPDSRFSGTAPGTGT